MHEQVVPSGDANGIGNGSLFDIGRARPVRRNRSLVVTNNDEPAPVDPNVTRYTATDLGDITNLDGPQFRKYNISGDADHVEYYRFALTEPMEVTLGLRQLDFDADFVLEDAQGNTIMESRKDGTTNEVIATTLLEGTYYIRVEAKNDDENKCVLRYGAAEPNADKAAELRKKLENDNDDENCEETEELESVGLVSNMRKSFSDKIAICSEKHGRSALLPAPPSVPGRLPRFSCRSPVGMME